MRAAVITKYNEPWELKEMPDPRPAPGQVLVRIHASGLCGTDLHVHHGSQGGKLPMVPGHQPAGEIVALGEGVLDLKMATVWRILESERMRALRFVSVGSAGALPEGPELDAPRRLPRRAHARLGLRMRAHPRRARLRAGRANLLRRLHGDEWPAQRRPRPGERVAVLGLGGLGHLALQLAKAVGLETVAVTGQADKKAELVAMGADEVVVAGDDPGAALRAAGGADVILSTTNSSKQVSAAFAGLRPRGRLVNMGVPDAPLVIDPRVLMCGSAPAARQLSG